MALTGLLPSPLLAFLFSQKQRGAFPAAQTVSGCPRPECLPLPDRVALVPEKAEAEPPDMLLLGSRAMLDVLILAAWEVCLFNNRELYRLF